MIYTLDNGVQRRHTQIIKSYARYFGVIFAGLVVLFWLGALVHLAGQSSPPSNTLTPHPKAATPNTTLAVVSTPSSSSTNMTASTSSTPATSSPVQSAALSNVASAPVSIPSPSSNVQPVGGMGGGSGDSTSGGTSSSGSPSTPPTNTTTSPDPILSASVPPVGLTVDVTPPDSSQPVLATN